jgi:hypothetical protein
MGPRGQPVIALVMILAMWIAVRVTLVALAPGPALSAPSPAAPGPVAASMPPRGPPSVAGPAPLAVPDHAGTGAEPPSPTAPGAQPAADLADEVRAPGSAHPPPQLAFEAASGAAAPPRAVAPPSSTPDRRPRWSADGWVLYRGEGSAPGLAAGAASYGGSQAGAVLRYALAPGSALRPQAYWRVSTALRSQVRQSESAIGLMARPMRRLPLAVLGELRLQQGAGPARVRPVVMAVSELPPLRLPLAGEAEIYAQAGWAGGRDATAFYDLAATVQRRVALPLRGVRFSAGAGVWSGGQRGAVRLDVGPRIEVRTLLGPPSRRIGVRVGVDWRFRVAGQAGPGSGPALTLSAGF